MDDEALFGPVAHRVWFREAVDLGILVDYELVAVLVTDAEVAELVRDRAGLLVDGKVLDAETLATLVSIRRAITDLSLTRSITFHHTIARARDFATALERLELSSAPPDAEHISGQMPVADRERVLQGLEAPGRPTVVTNARCLTEGIDVPGLDAVAFVDPRSSQVDIVQAVGRVMRRAKGKSRGHVLVPVFLTNDELADPEAAVAGSAFSKVIDVLRALRAHDPELTSDASRIRASLGPREAVSGGHIAEHVRLLGRGIDPARFENALELRFVEVAAQPFEVGLAVLRRFVEREEDGRVPTAHEENGFPLGLWVAYRRSEYRRGRLSAARAAMVQAIPGWTWEPIADDRDEVLAALRAFVARQGNTRVPVAHEENGVRLGFWVAARRAKHHAGHLNAARTAELESIPGWTWDAIADEWTANVAAVRSFADREGHARVPSAHEENSVRLGFWVANRRSEFKNGRLDPARVAELEAIPGWTWDPVADEWAANLAAVRSFSDREGHARVPRAHEENGVRLGLWVANRRREFKEGRLDAARAADLEATPGWSWGRSRMNRTSKNQAGQALQSQR